MKDERAEDAGGYHLHGPTVVALALCAAIDAADWAVLPGMFSALETEFGVTLERLGSVYLLQCLAGSLCMPLWGFLGDRAPRRELLCLGCGTWGLLTVLSGASQSFTEFTAYRTASAGVLALLNPITQSVVADLAASGSRGRLFGAIGSVATLGAVLGQFVATATSSESVRVPGLRRPVRGWRVCLVGVGALSIAFAPAIELMMREPKKGDGGGGPTTTSRGAWAVLYKPSFALLVAQGFFGCVPWRAFGMMSVYWFELLGYAPLTVAFMLGAGALSAAAGVLFSGFIGDALNSIWPFNGRVVAAQVSVAAGSILMATLLLGLPKDEPRHVLVYTLVIMLFNLVAVWCTNATNRPLVADICPEGFRATAFSVFACMESIPSAFGGYLVAWLASSAFGFQQNHSSTPPAGSDPRVDGGVAALTMALLWICMSAWGACFAIYSALHWTYASDVTGQQSSKIDKVHFRGQCPVGKRANASPKHDDEDETVTLLARGQRN